jgi:Fe-S-cluster containining protein
MSSSNPDAEVPGTATLDPSRFRAALHAIYAGLDAEVARLGPVCQLSGRCCRFGEYGHTLFVSAPEAALLLDEATPPVRPLDDGASCPWQDARGHCTAREARPLGCRVYYCDPAYEGRAEILSETFIGRLKRMADEHRLPWNYAPLHRHLHQAAAGGRFGPEADPSARGDAADATPGPQIYVNQKCSY